MAGDSGPAPAGPARLIVIGAVPPPAHGVNISNTLILRNQRLHDSFEVEHVDTSDHRSIANIERWDTENVTIGLRSALDLYRRTAGRRGVVYLPLSGGTAGLLRDSLYVHIAAQRGWVVTAHLRGGEFHHYFQRLSPVLAAWVRFTMRRLESIGAMAERLRSMFDGIVDADRVAVVTNGTPDPGPPPPGRDPETVLFFSNFRRRKGVVEAMHAARIVIAARPTARFVFAGSCEDPQLEAELHELARPLAGAVRFQGAVDGGDKWDLLHRAAILLFPPTESEGHPRVVLEGIAAGLAVVATDQGGIAETIVDGESGFVLPDSDPDALAERVLALLGDDELRERVAAAARERYLQEFTQERADERIARWLEDVAIRTELLPARPAVNRIDAG